MSILKVFFHLLSAGIVIGVLHQFDMLLAVLLVIIAILLLRQTCKKISSKEFQLILTTGMIMTGILGGFAELWGINYGYWEYHDLGDDRHYPLWLPFAWSLSFLFLYRIEARFIEYLKIKSLVQKLTLVALLSAVFPTFGEIIAIALGVWTYAWGYQFFGVPLLAIILLTIFHLLIYIAIAIICHIRQIDNAVFSFPYREKAETEEVSATTD